MAETYYIAKVYRQHNSMVITVPKPVCVALNMKVGQHMVFTWQQSEGRFRFAKFNPEGAKRGTDSGSSDRSDSGG